MLQGFPVMMMMIFVHFKKEGRASLVCEVFWRSGLIWEYPWTSGWRDVRAEVGGGWHSKNLFQRSEMAGHLGVSFPAQSLLPPFLGQWNVSPGRQLLICLVFVEELKLWSPVPLLTIDIWTRLFRGEKSGNPWPNPEMGIVCREKGEVGDRYGWAYWDLCPGTRSLSYLSPCLNQG